LNGQALDILRRLERGLCDIAEMRADVMALRQEISALHAWPPR
jgi:hypothetical protein